MDQVNVFNINVFLQVFRLHTWTPQMGSVNAHTNFSYLCVQFILDRTHFFYKSVVIVKWLILKNKSNVFIHIGQNQL